MSFTASATEEAPPSTTTSTSRSIHCRVTLAPTSGRFWLSAKMTSTLKPRLPTGGGLADAGQLGRAGDVPVGAGKVAEQRDLQGIGGLGAGAAEGQAAEGGRGGGGLEQAAA
ncbi:hypothetical protein ACFQY5_27190 [Paeniroseomonas aquatica]|uniref:hypothetical protein n=1 Tax=Paeniroseomonas aquatica TaxID=373043 RepID=UPI0036224EDF